MDIIPKIKFSLIASFETLQLKQKFFLLLFLFSLMGTLLPHHAYSSSSANTQDEPVFIINLMDTGYLDYLSSIKEEITDEYYKQQLISRAWKQANLTKALKQYLEERNSPLAEYASILIEQRNWKKIIALANAESTLCRKYIEATANCWGVGGSNLWDMGDNLGEGVVAMNRFLTHNPTRSKIKYSAMSFEDMNGFYKQPAAQHWVDNNTIIYDELVALEKSVE